jgi:hypothetical protein
MVPCQGIPTPLKNDGVKVSWDDDILNINGKMKMLQTNQESYMKSEVQNRND